MKKLLIIFLVIACSIGFASCGKSAKDDSSADSAAGLSNEIDDTEDQSTENLENPENNETDEPQWMSQYSDAKDIPAGTQDTEALKARAAAMQDYSHEEGSDAAPVSVPDDNILFLVNKTHPVSSEYKAEDMVKVGKTVSGIGTEETHQMRALAAEHLNEMFEGAKIAGFDLRLRTGYRSYSYQKTLFDSYAAKNGTEAANKYSALPGESEHQTGWCCDLGLEGVSLTGFTGTPEAEWVAEHAHEYGFVIRYPKDKEDITGYIYESWHVRYVGKEAASEMYENNLTLEEYLNVVD